MDLNHDRRTVSSGVFEFEPWVMVSQPKTPDPDWFWCLATLGVITATKVTVSVTITDSIERACAY